LKSKINDQTGKDTGCGGSIAIAGSSIGAMAVLGAALVFKKKREDK
jgi:LPXTG-motif cell wall-anchored protein